MIDFSKKPFIAPQLDNNSSCGVESYDGSDCCRKFNLKDPEYDADISAGYYQTKAALYFKGSATVSSASGSDEAFFLLYNPSRSKVNILINKTLVSNLSSTPIIVKTYLCTTPSGSKTESHNVANTNTYQCQCDPKGEIYSGKNLNLSNNKYCSTYALNSYSSLESSLSGSILLAPGKYYIVAVKPTSSSSSFQCSCSFSWWEERIESTCENWDDLCCPECCEDHHKHHDCCDKDCGCHNKDHDDHLKPHYGEHCDLCDRDK